MGTNASKNLQQITKKPSPSIKTAYLTKELSRGKLEKTVKKNVYPSYLSELPGNTNGPAEAIASDEQGLHTPTPKMTERKYVKVTQDSLPGNGVTVHSIFLCRATHTPSWNEE